MKKLLLLIFNLVISVPLNSIFDLSPWLIIQNSTPFPFTCKIIATCPPSNSTITLLTNNNANFVIDNITSETEGDETILLNFVIILLCEPEKTTVLNPIFSDEHGIFNPTITTISCIHESLQLKTIKNSLDNNRYISLNYHPETGIYMESGPISLYIKCLNNLKQNVRNIIVAALNSLDWLPY